MLKLSGRKNNSVYLLISSLFSGSGTHRRHPLYPHHRRRHTPSPPPTRSLEQLVLLWLRLRLLSLFNHQSCSLVCVCCLILLISAAQTCRPIVRWTPLTATCPPGRSGHRPLTPWPPRATTQPPTTSTPKPRLAPAPWRRARSRSLPLRPRP